MLKRADQVSLSIIQLRNARGQRILMRRRTEFTMNRTPQRTERHPRRTLTLPFFDPSKVIPY